MFLCRKFVLEFAHSQKLGTSESEPHLPHPQKLLGRLSSLSCWEILLHSQKFVSESALVTCPSGGAVVEGDHARPKVQQEALHRRWCYTGTYRPGWGACYIGTHRPGWGACYIGTYRAGWWCYIGSYSRWCYIGAFPWACSINGACLRCWLRFARAAFQQATSRGEISPSAIITLFITLWQLVGAKYS